MKRQLRLLTIVICSLASCLMFAHGTAESQKKRHRAAAGTIREEKLTVPMAVPLGCTQIVREFIAYISREKPDIASDPQAQNRWLSENLRKGLEHRLTIYKDFDKKNPDTPEGPPGNGDFVGSWDYPTSYSIANSRRYDNRVVVDVIFRWGPKTEYPGDRRLVSYALVREGNAWKIDDLYTFRGEFVTAGSLNQTFLSESYP